MISACPYHREKQSCGHTDRCPIISLGGDIDCTELTPIQIHHVRTGVERGQQIVKDLKAKIENRDQLQLELVDMMIAEFIITALRKIDEEEEVARDMK